MTDRPVHHLADLGLRPSRKVGSLRALSLKTPTMRQDPMEAMYAFGSNF